MSNLFGMVKPLLHGGYSVWTIPFRPLYSAADFVCIVIRLVGWNVFIIVIHLSVIYELFESPLRFVYII